MHIGHTVGLDMRVPAALTILAAVLGLLGAANLIVPKERPVPRHSAHFASTGAIEQIRG